ncbi:hypothetical protein HYH02_013539 [Chlamydomonas schloesseri]|uniref:Endoplasmic reticulum vesicle transporter C-terminal domain-containing protein n=1 Tax=Chlamydomonas schloesseri TaxID=2026947 RepID=A0A835T217_9CHLO|nr:hypothetical protein HYH02_013539 [Chlamydomonas schloesseri]|eukprot:KAG2431010.1 hypothetical protein HYH02_013539 [Chlamydomonas schloesseri]
MHRVTVLSVDLARRHALTINVDITFPAVPCAVLSIDVLDISGTAENDASFAHHMHVHKLRLDKAGNQIGKAEYHTPQSQQIMDTGSEQLVSVNIQEAMQHLVDMEDEADHAEGCHVYGTMEVKRVAGRLHMSVHQNMVFQMLPQLLGTHHIPKVLNMSHVIKHLGFGPHYPGQLNPLDGYVRMVGREPYSYKYFLKVVPTEFYNRLGRVTETHQYSVTEYAQPLQRGYAPAVDVHYDLSPIVMTINERPPSLLHFVVRLCAVVGGAFAVTRLTDRWVDWFVRLVNKGAARAP